MNITYNEYHSELRDIAECIFEEAKKDNYCKGEDFDLEQIQEDINDSRLHETIDGHQWIIYTAYHLDIIQHSDNSDYMQDNFGDECLGHALSDGISSLHQAIAFWALYADVQDKLNDLYKTIVD